MKGKLPIRITRSIGGILQKSNISLTLSYVGLFVGSYLKAQYELTACYKYYSCNNCYYSVNGIQLM